MRRGPHLNLSDQTVAVTGATGFIGAHLCRSLIEQGRHVRALVRSPHKAGQLNALGVQLIPGDLNNLSSLQQLVTGCSYVVHGAGAVRGNSQADFDAINVNGTANLIDAMTGQAAAARLLHLSSIVAREPQLSYYSASKRRGEDLLPDSGLCWTALRPPAVYGPGDTEMLPIFETMLRGFATVPGSPEARTSLIHVADVVQAILACLDAPSTAQIEEQIYELGDGTDQGYSWAQLADIAARVFNRKVRLWQVPEGLLNSVAAINIRLARLTGRAAMLTPPKLRELRHPDWVTSTQPLTADTGWRPQIQFEEGLRALNLA